eukprot:g5220.t1
MRDLSGDWKEKFKAATLYFYQIPIDYDAFKNDTNGRSYNHYDNYYSYYLPVSSVERDQVRKSNKHKRCWVNTSVKR